VAADQAAVMWTTAGIAAVQQGDLQRGLDYFRRATNASEIYAPAHYQLGLVLLGLGDTAAARVAFARAQSLNPNLAPPRIDR
jgi:Flp pilus assembly protein TadD